MQNGESAVRIIYEGTNLWCSAGWIVEVSRRATARCELYLKAILAYCLEGLSSIHITSGCHVKVLDRPARMSVAIYRWAWVVALVVAVDNRLKSVCFRLTHKLRSLASPSIAASPPVAVIDITLVLIFFVYHAQSEFGC